MVPLSLESRQLVDLVLTAGERRKAAGAVGVVGVVGVEGEEEGTMVEQSAQSNQISYRIPIRKSRSDTSFSYSL